jgi:hypothetical protein
MVIKGEWIKKAGGGKSLLYTQLEYKEVHKNVAGFNILLRTEQYEIQYELCDGDIVLLDASKGKMLVLGKERDALALYEGLKTYGEVCATILSSESSEYLSLRGKLLKAQHHIEQVLARIKDPVLARYVVYEIMLGSLIAKPHVAYKDKINFLMILIGNKYVGEIAGDYLKVTIKELYQKYTHDFDTVLKRISKSTILNEIICLRLEALKLHEMEISINKFLRNAGFEEGYTELRSVEALERVSASRLINLLNITEEKLRLEVLTKADILTSQHSLKTMQRISEMIPISIDAASFISSCRRKYKRAVNKKITSNNSKYILTSKDGGIELLPLIGGKAGNLAELNKLLPAENVSPWFAISDKAFQDVMDYKLASSKSFIKEIPHDAVTIREAIEKILEKKNLTDTEKSSYIRMLWESVSLPENLLRQISDAYKLLTGQSESDENFFAVRSSSLEEDTETAARAGEFETFLFIKDLHEIVKHIKKAWAGLWTERAIHNRKILGRNFEYRGGIIVQKIVWARVSGVIQTINVAKGELKEIIINAGLGLGEGIVSGIVAADQITVSKENFVLGRGLNFNYNTADKKERVIFDKTKGSGTIISDTLYHQRFRAALEYTEINDLVKLAADLEQQYGYPLDIEFALEGGKIFIMQGRPVATFLAAFNETKSNYQFSEIDHLLLDDEGVTK